MDERRERVEKMEDNVVYYPEENVFHLWELFFILYKPKDNKHSSLKCF